MKASERHLRRTLISQQANPEAHKIWHAPTRREWDDHLSMSFLSATGLQLQCLVTRLRIFSSICFDMIVRTVPSLARQMPSGTSGCSKPTRVTHRSMMRCMRRTAHSRGDLSFRRNVLVSPFWLFFWILQVSVTRLTLSLLKLSTASWREHRFSLPNMN